ncbi:MAG TPA: helix-turn-helix transcriptional regulator [Oscillospiraceae bacterium]|nr:helix-turn-helix transcriptional regulator [Oscillospiraceae bacterium]HPK35949.1 helix-turn-helix transcriptional regulator [Oscillospiraceae bacterium]HPR75642.1 helix-turn-helix transcriptional regulator [Oscillospiraceae bacterium]
MKNRLSEMEREQRLRNEILDRYKSIRQFALAVDVPYSSIMTGLAKGITGMSFDTVIKICRALELNPYEI